MNLADPGWEQFSETFAAWDGPKAARAAARIADVEALRAAIRSPTSDVVQLTRGGLEARLVRYSAGDLHVSGGTLNAGIRSLGSVPSRHVTVNVPLACEGGGVLNGIPLRVGSALVWGPGTEYEGYTPPGYRWVAMQVPIADLEEHLPALRSLGPWLSQPAVRPVSLGDSDRSRLNRLLEAIRPAALEEGRGVLASDFASRALSLVASVVSHALGGSPAHRRPPRPRDILRHAEAFLRANLQSEVYVSAVAHAVGVADRTLQAAFQQAYGVSPLGYLNVLRLHAARRMLLSSRSAEAGGVAEVARRCGERHLGRFAGRYRAHFGELPRQTLDRALAGAAAGVS